MRFWDSSALIPLSVEERYSGQMRNLMSEDADLAVWWGTIVECSSSFARIRREGIITPEIEQNLRNMMTRLAEYWTELAPSEEVRMTARRLLLRHPLRAADSLQLAAALVWAGGQPEDLCFVCLDSRLREAARAEGFVLQPSRME
jgi:predicted nucleic acid-binding protein